MSDERFARQYRCGLPPGFPLASSCTSIVHHLSGPKIHAQPVAEARRYGTKKVGTIFLISLCVRVWYSNTRTYLSLLGPCFKTGRITTIKTLRET